MSKFLRTSDISAAIDRVIYDAKDEIRIVSPYLDIHNQNIERLQSASKKGVRIILIHGKTELKPDMNQKLSTVHNLERYYYPELHAKCYMNEDTAIVTSMNLVMYSASNNREMGILIEKCIEDSVYIDIRNEVDFLLENSEKPSKKIISPQSKKRNSNKRITQRGFCIRCGEEIPFNPNRPYCGDCFGVWQRFGNPYYEEKFCHSCGQIETTSMDSPLCMGCDMDPIIS